MPGQDITSRVRQRLAYILLGAVLGAATMLVTQGKVVDGLYLAEQQLTIRNEDLLTELSHLQQEVHLLAAQSARNFSNAALRNIKVTVTNGDPLTQLEVTKFIRANVDFMIGTQIRVFADAPGLFTEVVDKKTLTVNGQRVAINLRTAVILSDTLYITVSTRAVPE